MKNRMSDSEEERERYNKRADRYVSQKELTSVKDTDMSLLLRPPYTKYRSEIIQKLRLSSRCLDLCSGMGEQSKVLLESGKEVTVSDISESSLRVIMLRWGSNTEINAVRCNIEMLPFAEETFDLVTCAGGLSYGDNEMVMHEIHRVLKSGGYFICVDSLNNNPIYRINRFLHYLRGNRSRATLGRMPTIKLIRRYHKVFGEVNCDYFGKFTWLCMILRWIFGQSLAATCSDWLDRAVRLEWLAFKFVMTAKKN